jgi:hypothetical protein
MDEIQNSFPSFKIILTNIAESICI